MRVRWMERKDVPVALALDVGLTEERILHLLRYRSCIGMVAEDRGAVAAVVLYELLERRLELLVFAGSDAGRAALADAVATKLSLHRRLLMGRNVPAADVAEQRFWTEHGGRCLGTVQDAGAECVRFVLVV